MEKHDEAEDKMNCGFAKTALKSYTVTCFQYRTEKPPGSSTFKDN
jgi:hypothetical protein